jgi:hypothetical protein
MIDDRHSKKTGAVTGNVIDFGATDVQSAIDEIGAARFALVAGVWDKLAPGMGAHAAGAAGSLIGERLRSGRWRQAEGLARVQQAFAADAKAAAIAKVHRWLARDIGLGPAAILGELQAWDVTGLPREYQLARHILMRQDEAAMALLRELVPMAPSPVLTCAIGRCSTGCGTRESSLTRLLDRSRPRRCAATTPPQESGDWWAAWPGPAGWRDLAMQPVFRCREVQMLRRCAVPRAGLDPG